MQIARENYLAAQKALLESEKIFEEQRQRQTESRMKFNMVQLELATLNNKNVNMVSWTSTVLAITIF